MHYWLGPYAIEADPEGGVSRNAPTGVRPVLNLTAPAVLADAREAGIALFASENGVRLGGDYTDLGPGADAPLSATARNTITSRLNLPQALVANTVAEMLWEVLTVQADPTGQARPYPLVPKSRGRVWELICKGRPTQRKRFDASAPEAVNLQLLLRNQYRQARLDSLEGRLPEGHYLKVLGAQVRKYAIDYRWFQPADVPDERPLEPSTTLIDDFNRANETPLAAPWVHEVGSAKLASNNVTENAAEGGGNIQQISRYNSALSGDDHFCEADLTIDGSFQTAGVTCRNNPGTDECYAAYVVNGSDIFQARYNLNDVETSIGVSGTVSQNFPDTARLICDGSTISIEWNGSPVDSNTDTNLSGELYCGLTVRNAANLDNFLAEDLAAGGAVPIFMHHYRQMANA